MASTRDWFNYATDLVINGIDDLEKSVDDVLAACETEEKLEEVLDTICTRCKDHGVTLSKKNFSYSTIIMYGGHILDTTADELVVKPNPEKLERLCSFPSPNTKEDVQSLIGVIKTFDIWSMNLSAKCEKIRELNKEKEAFRWTLDHKLEFQELKKNFYHQKASWHMIGKRKNQNIYRCGKDWGHGLHPVSRK